MSAVNFLEKLKDQLAGFISQREQIATSFQQVVGAIFACEKLIKDHEEQLKNSEPVVETEG